MNLKRLRIDIYPDRENQRLIIHDQGEVLAHISVTKSTERRVELIIDLDNDELDIDREKVFLKEFPLENIIRID